MSREGNLHWILVIVIIVIASMMALLFLYLFMRRKMINLQRENIAKLRGEEAENIQQIDDNVAAPEPSMSAENEARAEGSEGVVVEAERTTQAMETAQGQEDV